MESTSSSPMPPGRIVEGALVYVPVWVSGAPCYMDFGRVTEVVPQARGTLTQYRVQLQSTPVQASYYAGEITCGACRGTGDLVSAQPWPPEPPHDNPCPQCQTTT